MKELLLVVSNHVKQPTRILSFQHFKEFLLAVSNHVTFFNKLEKLKFQHNANYTKHIFIGFCPSSVSSSFVGGANWSTLSFNKVL